MTRPDPPAPAADCHVHVFDPARFPYDRAAAYRPARHETAPVEQLLAVLDGSRLSHALVVTPTAGYGTNNAATAAAIAWHPARLKGIAVVTADAGELEIRRVKSQGFVGVRFDLTARGPGYLAGAGRRLLSILRDHDMVLTIQTEANALSRDMVDLLRREAGPVVFDHMARPDPSSGPGAPGFQTFLELSQIERVAVKLSGPFRFSRQGFPYTDADDYAALIIDAFGPERCVWGSDWPFVRMDHRIDYVPALAALERWLPDPADRRAVLWDTPSRLFGFTAVP